MPCLLFAQPLLPAFSSFELAPADVYSTADTRYCNDEGDVCMHAGAHGNIQDTNSAFTVLHEILDSGQS